jgi:nucleolar protein 12
LLPRKPRTAPEEEEDDEANEDEEAPESTGDGSEDESDAESNAEVTSDEDDELAGGDGSEDEGSGDASSIDDEAEAAEVLERAVSRGTSQDEGRKRKRKQRDDDEDLEANYLERLAHEEQPSGKRRKADSTAKASGTSSSKEDDEEKAAEKDEEDESGDDVLVHESLAGGSTAGPAVSGPVASELEKANRTVFLSNVSVEAITSRKAKKTLLNHLSSVLDKKADPPQKVQSIRFRSTAFETAGIPKRAAYIKKTVMEATTKSTNAYVVYTTTAAARVAASQLNGTVVLDRHLRVDSVAHPAPVDHRRCVFVGNLGFVDDETVYNTKLDEEGKEVTEKRKRTKTPMDVEEGLWRVFGKEAGKVESVRVVRDPATRVGKGFAYVQFYVSSSPPSLLICSTNKPTGWERGRIRHPPQRQEIPSHAPPRAARQPLQGAT